MQVMMLHAVLQRSVDEIVHKQVGPISFPCAVGFTEAI